MTVGLVLGDLDLMDKEGSPFAVTTQGEGTDWGNPQPIEVAVRSLLQDGSIVVHQGDDNREVSLRVIITAPDSAALAEGEAALMAELYRPNTLTYTPADGWGPATVFKVITSSLAHTMDDLGEIRGQRTWSVRLVCAPFGQSEDEVTISALATSGTTTTSIDDGTSTTGWTGSGTVSTQGGAVRNTSASMVGKRTDHLERTIAAVNMSTTPYLVVDWSSTQEPYGGGGLVVKVDGVEVPLVASAATAGGLVRSTFYTTDPSATAFRFELTTTTKNWQVPAARVLSIAQLSRSDIRPTSSTARQQMRAFEVPGSARTRGGITLSHATTALGDAIIYTFRDPGVGYSPAMRPNYLQGALTADASLVSGARNMLDTKLIYRVPVSTLPEGLYVLVARLRGSAPGTATVNVGVQTLVGGTTVGPASEADDGNELFRVGVTFSGTTPTAWTNVTLGRLRIPMVGMADTSTATLDISLIDDDLSGIDVDLDELWLFNLSIGDLTMASCGTGTAAAGGPSRILVVDAPTVDVPRPRLLRAHSTDLSDAFYPGDEQAWGGHGLVPPSMAVFTVTSNAENADATAVFYPSWHTHAGS